MPTNNTLLMTADYYKRNSAVNLNVDAELIIPHIKKAQNMWIEKILGTNLFDVVVSEIQAGSVSSRIETLLKDYIQPVLVEYTTYVALPYLNYKITNKAISKKFSDNSDYAELNEMNYLKSAVRNDAEYLANRLTKFLQADSGQTYPEYFEGIDSCDKIAPSRKNFFGGIYLAGNDVDCDYGVDLPD